MSSPSPAALREEHKQHAVTLGNAVVSGINDRAELIEALRFYANGQRYKGSNQEPIEGDPYGPKGFVYLWDVMRDGGEIANKTLAKAK